MYPENEPQTPVNPELPPQSNSTDQPQESTVQDSQPASWDSQPQEQSQVVSHEQQQTMGSTMPLQQPPINQGAPVQMQQQPVDPGKGLGIASVVFAFIIPIAGLILSIVARNKSKKAGHSNGLASVGLVISIITTIISTLALAAIIFVAQTTLQQRIQDNAKKAAQKQDESSLIQTDDTKDAKTDKTEGNELNSLGTVASPELQADLVRKMQESYYSKTGKTGTFEVISITSNKISDTSFSETWSVSIGGEDVKFAVDLTSDDDGNGTSFAVYAY